MTPSVHLGDDKQALLDQHHDDIYPSITVTEADVEFLGGMIRKVADAARKAGERLQDQQAGTNLFHAQSGIQSLINAQIAEGEYGMGIQMIYLAMDFKYNDCFDDFRKSAIHDRIFRVARISGRLFGAMTRQKKVSQIALNYFDKWGYSKKLARYILTGSMEKGS